MKMIAGQWGREKKRIKKPPKVKQEISPNKFKECLGFCLHREGI